jgi:hypothetical protein
MAFKMKRFFFIFVFLFAWALSANAQVQDEALFGTPANASKVREGFVITMNGNLDFPAGDMAKRFGTSYRFGPSVMYKTGKGWLIGAKFDFISGANIREDSLMINIYKDGGIIGQVGNRVAVNVYERGYDVGLQGGKLLNIFPSKASTLMLMTTVGFIQHKIKIFDRDKLVYQLRDDYKKGYDRLTNGILVEQFVGYNYFAHNGFLNFYIGFNFSAGFTGGRRDYLYDVMRPDNANRIDILYGLRGGLHIPIFNRKSEELYFK